MINDNNDNNIIMIIMILMIIMIIVIQGCMARQCGETLPGKMSGPPPPPDN